MPTTTYRRFASRSRRARKPQQGAALLEALVAVLLLMLGIMALIGLQGRMVSASTEAQMRGEATYLADQLIGQMSVDQGNLANYETTGSSCTSANCTAWLTNVANTLPSGTATVTVVGDSSTGADVTVQVYWTPANSSQRTVQVSAAINY